MKAPIAVLLVVVLAGCVAPPPMKPGLDPAVLGEVPKGGERKPQARPESVEQALLPPLRMEMPSVRGQPIDQRFDLSVSNAPAAQVFMSIVSGTRYSMLVHPSVTGTISVNLKDVTLQEALDSIRDLYGYDYRVEGTRVFIQPAGLQTRIFQVNYLLGSRAGTSDVRVQSGSVTDATGGGGGAPAGVAGVIPPATGGSSRGLESSRVTTRIQNDFWAELRTSLSAIVGTGEGRSVVISPQSGVVVVRALPAEPLEVLLRELGELRQRHRPGKAAHQGKDAHGFGPPASLRKGWRVRRRRSSGAVRRRDPGPVRRACALADGQDPDARPGFPRPVENAHTAWLMRVDEAGTLAA